MLNRKEPLYAVSACLAMIVVSAFTGCAKGPVVGEEIPARIGNWRVEVGPAGNEVYQHSEEKIKPPTDVVLRWPAIIAPHTSIDKWELDFDDDEYEIDTEVGDEEYEFKVTPAGDLVSIEYENDETYIKEVPDELVLKGTKQKVELTDVPPEALKTLAKALPNAKPDKAFAAQTIAGKRYGIVIGDLVFYARPDGQIQAAGLVEDDALDEVDPRTIEATGVNLDPEAFNAQLEKQLGPYRERFNFANQIRKLGQGPKGADSAYRYIVLGDSRSKWELWSNIVKHIDQLDPKPAFVINVGDIVPDGFMDQFRDYYIPPLLETDIPYFVSIGNHDEGVRNQVREYRYLFGENSLNYYFDYGKARYVFIDNNTDATDEDEMLEWLGQTLAETPAGFRKIVAPHYPPGNIEKWEYHSWGEDESEVFTDLMTKHEVDAVYLGHIHAYSTAVLGGVQYTISGGGGAGLHDRFGPLGNVHHYVICDVAPDGTVKQQVVRFYEAE